MDTLASGDYQGVKHKHIVDFLLDERVLGE